VFGHTLICIVGGGVQTGSTRPLTGLLYLPWVIVRMENLVEWMAGETEVLRENLPQRHFVHHKSHSTRPGIEPGSPRPLVIHTLWKNSTTHTNTHQISRFWQNDWIFLLAKPHVPIWYCEVTKGMQVDSTHQQVVTDTAEHSTVSFVGLNLKRALKNSTDLTLLEGRVCVLDQIRL
jgi:hypothetical protein